MSVSNFKVIVTDLENSTTIIEMSGRMHPIANNAIDSLSSNHEEQFVWFFDDISNKYYFFNKNQVKSIVYEC